jgi:hypothetical protein
MCNAEKLNNKFLMSKPRETSVSFSLFHATNIINLPFRLELISIIHNFDYTIGFVIFIESTSLTKVQNKNFFSPSSQLSFIIFYIIKRFRRTLTILF